MSACEILPQELIMAIADNIWEDKKSLKAFSLVCKAWTNPAREHLFRSLAIDDENLGWIKAANTTSTYTPFLRHLHLESYNGSLVFWREVIPFLAEFRTPRLRSLALTFLPWQSLSPHERSAFLSRFESIISLRLSLDSPDTSNSIATIVCSLPNLHNLTLSTSGRRYGVPGPSPLSPAFRLPQRLSTLHVKCAYYDYRFVLGWLGSIPEQLSIHTLHLYMCWLLPQDLDVVNKFLKTLGPSLEVFICYSEDHLPIDLTYNTRLRCVEIRFCKSTQKFKDVLFAMSSLSRIGSQQLEQITFRDVPWGNVDFPIMEWIQLDAVLARPQFATLKDIRIYALPCPPGTTNLSPLFHTSLPTCHARGIISFVHPSPFELW